MKTNIIFAVVSLFIFNNVFGQDDVGFKANLISSFIPFKDVSTYQTALADQKNLISPSGQIGMFYCHTFKNRTFIGTDLLFNQVESRTSYIPNMQTDQSISNTPSGPFINTDYSEEYRMHLTYLSLPVYYGYKISRFSFNLGFQTSLKLGTSYTVKSHSSAGTYSAGNQALTKIDNLDYGLKVGLSWKLSTYLDLEGTWYHGLNNITHDPFLSNYREYRIRQLSIGIRYILTRKK